MFLFAKSNLAAQRSGIDNGLQNVKAAMPLRLAELAI
jgi:hypothetical protein